MLTFHHILRWALVAVWFLGSDAAPRTTIRGCKCQLNYKIGGKRYLGGSCVPGSNGGKPWCQVVQWYVQTVLVYLQVTPPDKQDPCTCRTCKSRLPAGQGADVCAAGKPAPKKKKTPIVKKAKKAKKAVISGELRDTCDAAARPRLTVQHHVQVGAQSGAADRGAVQTQVHSTRCCTGAGACSSVTCPARLCCTAASM
jgi:hypothetical protein